MKKLFLFLTLIVNLSALAQTEVVCTPESEFDDWSMTINAENSELELWDNDHYETFKAQPQRSRFVTFIGVESGDVIIYYPWLSKAVFQFSNKIENFNCK